jgi:hypothetical protein
MGVVVEIMGSGTQTSRESFVIELPRFNPTSGMFSLKRKVLFIKEHQYESRK